MSGKKEPKVKPISEVSDLPVCSKKLTFSITYPPELRESVEPIESIEISNRNQIKSLSVLARASLSEYPDVVDNNIPSRSESNTSSTSKSSKRVSFADGLGFDLAEVSSDITYQLNSSLGRGTY